MMKLSIITVNLNNHDGLQRTINSVVSQTFRDFEWIVVDGGSTDGSKKLIERYSSHIAYWVSEPDAGIYNAMNKGIRVAHGDYLLFLNSGDWLCNSEVLSNVFQKEHTAEIIYGYMVRGSLNGEPCHAAMMKPVLYWYDFIGNSLPHQASFIARKAFDKYGLYDESYKIAADTKFFIIAIVWNKASYEFVPMKIAVFEGGGISTNKLMREERDIRLSKEMFPEMMLDDIPLLTTLRRVKSNMLLRKSYTLLALLSKKCTN